MKISVEAHQSQSATTVGSSLAQRTEAFNRLLLGSIDEALFSLGESSRQSIYFHVEHTFRLPRNEIPENLCRFQSALEKIFGGSSRLIEILIMKSLYGKINEPLLIGNNEELEFIAYIEAARNSCK